LKLAIYWGCIIPTSQYVCEMSVREVLPRLGIELVELDNVSCCGTPVQSVNAFASLYLATRNLAIAEKSGFDELLTICNSCYLSFSEAIHCLNQNEKLQEKVNSVLKDEELEYKGPIKLLHIIELLHDVVERETLTKSIKKTLNGLKLASHPGCHSFRPSSLGMIDDPENPKKLDNLIELLRAKVIDYPERLDCCGELLMLSHPDAAFTFTGLKIKAVQDRSVDGLIDSCPSCHMMFDMRQRSAGATVGCRLNLPVLYYTQLLGVAMGIEEEKLGLHLNRSPVNELLEKIG